MGLDHAALLDRATERSPRWRGAGDPEIPWSTAWVAEHTCASYRQLDYWIRHGLVREDLMALGSGARRRFEPADVEVIHALAALADLGCTADSMEIAAAAVRARRVGAPGEWLVVTRSRMCARFPDEAIEFSDAAWVVPLIPATAIVPAGDPSDSTAGPPAGTNSTRGAA